MNKKPLLKLALWSSVVGVSLLTPHANVDLLQPALSDAAGRGASLGHPGILQDSLEIPQDSGEIVERILAPFLEEAKRRREQRLEGEPDYVKRIDWGLNKDRVNILLYGHGEIHEPPLTERAFIGSITIASYHIPSRKIDVISLNHDIRSPETERYRVRTGKHDGRPIKIYRAYADGGFDLLGLTVENATGLSADFQIAFDDTFLKDLVDEALGGIEVDVPTDFDVAPFYLEGKKYPEGHFSKGKERLTGLRVLQFIKTVPKAPKGSRSYPKSLEHNARKHMAFGALAKSLEEKVKDPIFFWRMYTFLTKEGRQKRIAYNFEANSLFINHLDDIAISVGRFLVRRNEGRMPEAGKTIYIVDPASGDGGVRWVAGSESPVIRKELREGRYPDLNFAVPYQADPYAEDLVAHYWPSVRNRVKQLMSEK